MKRQATVPGDGKPSFYVQIRMDGSEVELGDEFPVSRNAAPLNAVQRAILRLAGADGGVRSVEAGVVVHAARSGGCWRARHGIEHNGVGCCRYASADGLEACKRLARRGLLRRTTPGRWEPT